MNARWAPRFVMLAIVATTTVGAGQPQKVEVKPDETWVHPGAKVEFPPVLGAGIRREIYHYGPDDYSAGYAIGAAGEATLYVYPIGSADDSAEATEVTAAIREKWDNVVVEKDEEWTLRQGDRHWSGRRLTYSLSRKGQPDLKLKSFLWLARFGSWQIKLRVTCGAPLADMASATGEKMLVVLKIP